MAHPNMEFALSPGAHDCFRAFIQVRASTYLVLCLLT